MKFIKQTKIYLNNIHVDCAFHFQKEIEKSKNNKANNMKKAKKQIQNEKHFQRKNKFNL